MGLNGCTCKHFRGLRPGDELCHKGINPRDLDPAKGKVPGLFYRIPCKTGHGPKYEYDERASIEEGGGKGTCDLFELPTAEEIKADAEAMSRAMEEMGRRLDLVGPVIGPLKQQWKKDRKPNQVRVTCPVCKAEEALFISIAGTNGHALVKCSTTDCLSFME